MRKILYIAFALLIVLAIAVPVMAQAEDEEEDNEGSYYCENLTEQHPVAAYLAETYETPYEQIMEWFCMGNFGFGEIKSAFKASMLLEGGYSIEQILDMKEELGGWGQVKQELGLIGKDRQKPAEGLKSKPAFPPGNPDKETGPPDHANNDKEKNKDKDKDKGK